MTAGSAPALVLRGLGKDYGERTVVRALDLELARGECLGLLGPNGAGKTTTISMVSGVLTRTRGTVTIAGADLGADPYGAKAKLGVVPQDLAIYDELTALQNLRYFGALYGLRGSELAARIEWVLDVVGLADRATEIAKRYSGGMKRRLNLAAGLLHEPPVLILDEPTVGVDPQSRNHIFATVRRLHADGMSIVYTSHYMEEVEALCDRVAIMDGGAIVATGRVSELVAAHAGRGITITLSGSPAAIDAAFAAAAAHGTIARSGNSAQLVATGGLAPPIAAIEAAGATITRIESHDANLETAFLALTGHGLRDEAA